MITTVLGADGLLVEHYMAALVPSSILFITFTERSNRNLKIPGFGVKFLLEQGIDVVAVKTDRDDWYENLTKDHIKIIVSYVQGFREYKKVIGYGSSMGAHAAIKYSRELNMDGVIALSPVWGLHFPWESRWKDDFSRLGGKILMPDNAMSTSCAYCIVGDMKSRDRSQLEVFISRATQNSVKLEFLNIPYSGHPSGFYLRDAGLLKKIVVNFSSYQVHSISRQEVRRSRRKSFNYCFNLARECFFKKKFFWCLSLCEYADANFQLDSNFSLLRARAYSKLGNKERARSCARYTLDNYDLAPSGKDVLTRILYG